MNKLNNNNITDFEGIIKNQREKGISAEEIIRTVKQLPNEHLVDYLEFLEHNESKLITKEVGEAFLRKLGAKTEWFIEKNSEKMDSVNLGKLEQLVFARTDSLLDTYLHLILPDETVNEFVILKAQRINEKFKGKYHNALSLINLAVELNRVEEAEDLYETFLKMETRYYEENEPNVDINTFYKLVIPILRRYSIKKGPTEFYDMRDKIIDELRKHGVNPGHLSIEILERRGKHRVKPPTHILLQGYELY